MKTSEFVDLVKRMRIKQRAYFKDRDKQVLTKSKSLEREVDYAIDQYESRQQSLALENEQ